MEAEPRGCAWRTAFPLPRGGSSPGFPSRSPAESPAPGPEAAAGHTGRSVLRWRALAPGLQQLGTAQPPAQLFSLS